MITTKYCLTELIINDSTNQDFFLNLERLRAMKDRIRDIHASSSYRYLRSGTKAWNTDYIDHGKEEKRKTPRITRIKG